MSFHDAGRCVFLRKADALGRRDGLCLEPVHLDGALTTDRLTSINIRKVSGVSREGN